MSCGWIKLHREIQEHWIYPRGREFTEYEAWQDIILSVNHKPRKVKIKNRLLECGRGESLRSTKNWARRWNWSKSKVYRFFNLLESDGMIETESETVTTRLSVCNYSTYQYNRNGDETQLERKRNAGETEADTNKNEKNGKNEKKKHIPTLQEVKDYFKENGYDTKVAEKAYNIYNASIEDHPKRKYWRDSRDNLIKNWKLKMQSVWFKEENKAESGRINENGQLNYNPIID